VGITEDDVRAVQAELGPAWFVGTATYPEGERLTALPWPPKWDGRIVTGATRAEVLAAAREKEAERDRIRSEHVPGRDGHTMCPSCGRCPRCDQCGPHSISGPW